MSPPFHRFPIEILREIIEIAAQTRREDALSLSLVSSLINQWVDRVLFRTLRLCGDREYILFYRRATLATRPIPEGCIRHVWFSAPFNTNLVTPAILDTVFTVCSSATSVALPVKFVSTPSTSKTFFNGLRLFRPRTVTLFSHENADFSHPIFERVTNLHVRVLGNRFNPETFRAIAALPNLTHLHMRDFDPKDDAPFYPCLSILLAQPFLNVVTVRESYRSYYPRPNLERYRVAKGVKDPRFALLPPHEQMLQDMWPAMQIDEETYWEEVEKRSAQLCVGDDTVPGALEETAPLIPAY